MILLRRYSRIKEDAAIGIVLSTFFGAGIVLLAIVQRHGTGNRAGLDSYIFGETASIQSNDIVVLAATALVSLILVLLLFKEFQLLSFDPDFASAQGWPTTALDVMMMGALATVTIIGLPIVGVILMAALIILPGATARFWTDRLGVLLLVAGASGALAGILGTLLASPKLENWLGFDPLEFGPTKRNLPPGPLIVLSATGLFLVSLLCAPRRGVLARTWAEFRLRQRIGKEHLMRSLYELSENSFPDRTSIDRADLYQHRTWNWLSLHWWLWRAHRRGWIDLSSDACRLTASGLQQAAAITRRHRLWELYLVENANIAADHVDRDADDVEHLLPEQLVRELEERLAENLAGSASSMPESPHQVNPHLVERPAPDTNRSDPPGTTP